jgi:hypothetical protein
MPDMISVTIPNLEAVLGKLDVRLYADALRKFWERSAIVVQGRAREKSPVDTGRLRSSIMYEIDAGSPPWYAAVGSDVFYAPYQEFGTSRGVPAVGYLSGGFEESLGDIQTFVDALGSEIEAKWAG